MTMKNLKPLAKTCGESPALPLPAGSAPVLPDRLDWLAQQMCNVASEMEYYGGFNTEIVEHSKELFGAANIALGWAKGIRRASAKAGKCADPSGDAMCAKCDCWKATRSENRTTPSGNSRPQRATRTRRG
jgi:hypothetical protein